MSTSPVLGPLGGLLSATLVAHTRLSDDGLCSCGHRVPLGYRFTDHQAEAQIAAVADIERGRHGVTKALARLIVVVEVPDWGLAPEVGDCVQIAQDGPYVGEVLLVVFDIEHRKTA